MTYNNDILDDFTHGGMGSAKRPAYPDVVVEMGMVVEDRSSHFTGDIARWNAEGVTLRDAKQYLRHFSWKPGGFLILGEPVTLVRPKQAKSATQRVTA